MLPAGTEVLIVADEWNRWKSGTVLPEEQGVESGKTEQNDMRWLSLRRRHRIRSSSTMMNRHSNVTYTRNGGQTIVMPWCISRKEKDQGWYDFLGMELDARAELL